MPGKTTVKLNKDLCQRAARVAEKAGYSSLEEFIEHALEKDLRQLEDSSENSADLIQKLKGLGYLE